MNIVQLRDIVASALKEDIGFGDLTTEAIAAENTYTRGTFTVKSEGVLAGLQVAKQVFAALDPTVKWEAYVPDGQSVRPGQTAAAVEGPVQHLLSGERVALNLLQHMSGIASMTHEAKKKAERYGAHISDTRKTIPGMRMLEKYAVRMGGGVNHRLRLDDAVMIKDNHIALAGGITEAVRRVRKAAGHTVKIEVETETLEQVQEAVQSGTDIVMLDNMTLNDMRRAVEIVPDHIVCEASGNITLEQVEQVAATGVDVISIGWLTHSAPALDISFNIRESCKQTNPGSASAALTDSYSHPKK